MRAQRATKVRRMLSSSFDLCRAFWKTLYYEFSSWFHCVCLSLVLADFMVLVFGWSCIKSMTFVVVTTQRCRFGSPVWWGLITPNFLESRLTISCGTNIGIVDSFSMRACLFGNELWNSLPKSFFCFYIWSYIKFIHKCISTKWLSAKKYWPRITQMPKLNTANVLHHMLGTDRLAIPVSDKANVISNGAWKTAIKALNENGWQKLPMKEENISHISKHVTSSC
jgi:hypothetical protein